MHFKLSKKIFFVLLLLPIIWSLCTKNPAGTSIESNYETISSLEFLYDLTYQKQQKSVKEQSILSAELDIIEKAEDFIVLDLFLYTAKVLPIEFPQNIFFVSSKLTSNPNKR